MKSIFDDECTARGQSEVTAFAIIIALSITVFSLVLGVGLPAIGAAQGDEAMVVTEHNIQQLEQAARSTTGTDTGATLEQTIPPGEYTHQDNGIQLIFTKGGNNQTTVRSASIHYRENEAGAFAYDYGLMATMNENSVDFKGLPDTSPEITTESIYRPDGTAPEIISWELFAMDVDRPGDRSGNRGQSIEYFVTPREPGSSYTMLTSEPGAPVEIRVRTDDQDMWTAYLELHPAFEGVSRDDEEIVAEIVTGTTLSLTVYHLDVRIRG